MLSNVCFAQQAEKPKPAENQKPKPAEKPKPKPAGEPSITEHSIELNSGKISYTATAGMLKLNAEILKSEASVFYVAYTKKVKNQKEKQDRPIAFCFNGGPGSSAVWLHMGGLGPKRVHLTEDGMMPPPPFKLKDNKVSILDVADLVFIDPVNTGYSRPSKKDKGADFLGFSNDLKSVAEAVRLYVHQNGRWLSPKYLVGESYGALRVCGLSETLQNRYGMYLNGIVLVSGVIDFKTLFKDDLAYVCFLPAMAEVAMYHNKLDADLVGDPDAFRKEVEAFAKNEYASALLKGSRMTPEERQQIVDKLSKYTSLEKDLIDRVHLKISGSLFREELLKSEGKTIGRFDARVIGPARSASGDPSYDVVYGPFASTVKHYISQELKFKNDTVYEVLSRRVHPWSYKGFEGTSVKATRHLAEGMAKNPYMKVMVNCGRQDLATPPFAIQHSLDLLPIDPELTDNIQYTYYEGGHMMYTIEQSNTEWNDDVRDFIEATKQGGDYKAEE